jgi:hypothetical protein
MNKEVFQKMEFYSSEIFNYIINNKKKILEMQNNKEEEIKQKDDDIIEVKNYNVIDEEDLIEGE